MANSSKFSRNCIIDKLNGTNLTIEHQSGISSVAVVGNPKRFLKVLSKCGEWSTLAIHLAAFDFKVTVGYKFAMIVLDIERKNASSHPCY